MATTYSQMAGLLKSGVPLLRSIDVLRQQSSHGGLKEVLSQVYSDVEDGSTLAEAMATSSAHLRRNGREHGPRRVAKGASWKTRYCAWRSLPSSKPI